MTHGQQEKMLQQTRRQEEMREDRVKQLAHERRLEANMLGDDRVEDKRFIRRMQMEKKEREMEEAILKVSNMRSVIGI